MMIMLLLIFIIISSYIYFNKSFSETSINILKIFSNIKVQLRLFFCTYAVIFLLFNIFDITNPQYSLLKIYFPIKFLIIFLTIIVFTLFCSFVQQKYNYLYIIEVLGLSFIGFLLIPSIIIRVIEKLFDINLWFLIK